MDAGRFRSSLTANSSRLSLECSAGPFLLITYPRWGEVHSEISMQRPTEMMVITAQYFSYPRTRAWENKNRLGVITDGRNAIFKGPFLYNYLNNFLNPVNAQLNRVIPRATAESHYSIKDVQ